jgi:hypothetical protein
MSTEKRRAKNLLMEYYALGDQEESQKPDKEALGKLSHYNPF